MRNRNGSLNLSIQMIVIVVIAFVVLGLGLGFVRNQFSSIEETASSVQEQIRQQILDDLRTGNKKLSFPATSLTVERGGSKDIAVGVKNTGDVDLHYKMDVKIQKDQEGAIPEMELENHVKFFFDNEDATLGPTEPRVHAIRVSGVGNTGTYLVKLSVLDVDNANEIYDEKTFFVTII